MTARQAQRRLQAAVAALMVLGTLGAAVTALFPARALAHERSGSAIVEYSPQTWPFAISVSGSGQLELTGVRSAQDAQAVASRAAASGMVVRDGTSEMEVSPGQLLDFRLVPDEGASVVSVLVGGEDALGSLEADGRLTLASEDAQIEMKVAFSDVSQGSASGNDGGAGALGALVRTGDFWWIGAIVMALVAASAFFTARYAAARRSRSAGKEVPPRESA